MGRRSKSKKAKRTIKFPKKKEFGTNPVVYREMMRRDEELASRQLKANQRYDHTPHNLHPTYMSMRRMG